VSETVSPVEQLAPVHFIGISGIGMSALARLLLARGVEVRGSSDRRNAIVDRLEAEGARVAIGHDAHNLGDARTVVVSSAIAQANPELVEARARGLRVEGRGALLASLMNPMRGLAVAGTHGKTTTTAMLASVFEAAELDPTVAVGGEIVATGSNARAGNGPWFVTESDESDGSFLDLHPRIAVVTNVENDHVASDAEFAVLLGSFATFLEGLGEGCTAVVGTDNPAAAELAARPRTARTVTFGFGDADVTARAVAYADFGSGFDLHAGDLRIGRIALHVPGAINVQNALAAAASAIAAGVGFDGIAAGLERFQGVRRRFEIIARTPRMTIVDDYAHHPTAVEATIATARAYWDGPIVVAFEPHRYTRTRYLAREFALALRGADQVLLAPVYAASEPPMPGVGAATIGEPLRAMGCDVAYVDRVADVPDAVLRMAPEGSLVLVLGAGSITDAARGLARLVASAADGAPAA
jgi:UDP-N-acetylmuramate--alanine ligase